MDKGAIISECGKYRYQLYRIWDRKLPFVMFCMLNPSTADATKDDRTIEKIKRFTEKWEYGGFYVGNLFAYRSTNPAELSGVNFPLHILTTNLDHIKKMAAICELKMLAHGNPPIDYPDFKRFPFDWHYLKLTKSGNPYHPLYLKEDLTPIKF